MGDDIKFSVPKLMREHEIDAMLSILSEYAMRDGAVPPAEYAKHVQAGERLSKSLDRHPAQNIKIPQEEIDRVNEDAKGRYVHVVRWEPEAQEAKHDAGKPQLRLIPPALLTAVGEVRTYGTKKYKDPENWRQVDAERYKDAFMRHLVPYLRDPASFDEESGLPHLWHMACNIAFLCEYWEEGKR